MHIYIESHNVVETFLQVLSRLTDSPAAAAQFLHIYLLGKYDYSSKFSPVTLSKLLDVQGN